MTKKFNQFLGKAGHLHMMAEFLMKGWNVAIPEVDIGDDIFVVKDDEGTLRKVQVKTARGKTTQTGYMAQFSASETNLAKIDQVIGHYVFIIRLEDDTWSKPVIIKQDVLYQMYLEENVGSLSGQTIVFRFKYTENGDKVVCSKKNLSEFINDYGDFPQIEH